MSGTFNNPEFDLTKVVDPKFRKYFSNFKRSEDVDEINLVYLGKLLREFKEAEQRLSKIKELIV